MTRQITWSLHSENGRWDTSFNVARISDYLNFLGRYWDIAFSRNNDGRIKYYIANQANPNIAASTSGFICRINYAYNFNVAGAINRDMLCAKVACHEFGHMCRSGGAHAGSPGLMDPNASMPTGNLAPVDYWWFDVYPRKAGALRPHEEPNAMRRAFIPGFTASALASSGDDSLEFGCTHSPSWYAKLTSGIWVKP